MLLITFLLSVDKKSGCGNMPPLGREDWKICATTWRFRILLLNHVGWSAGQRAAPGYAGGADGPAPVRDSVCYFHCLLLGNFFLNLINSGPETRHAADPLATSRFTWHWKLDEIMVFDDAVELCGAVVPAHSLVMCAARCDKSCGHGWVSLPSSFA